jgi:2'-5' RNA ligase
VVGELHALQQLQKAITVETKRWGEPEERGFHPHLTLGRTKTTRGRELQELGTGIKSVSLPNLGNWQVTHMGLMRSELFPDGARHSCLATVPMAAPSFSMHPNS